MIIDRRGRLRRYRRSELTINHHWYFIEPMPIPKKILLVNKQCPGDCLVMSAAIESLMQQYPGQYQIGVSTACNAIFDQNPHLVALDEQDPEVQVIRMEYPLINHCNGRAVHFMEGYVRFLAQTLDIKLELSVTKPVFYLSDQERQWMSQLQELGSFQSKFWVINAGYKHDYTTKKWTQENYQRVVDHFYGRLLFAQVGELSSGHFHTPLKNCIDLLGKTDVRQLLRLCWHAQGGLGGVSFIHHVFAALQKPFVCIASGMEPQHWERYHTERYLCKGQCVPCGQTGGCWKSKVVRLGDTREHSANLCSLPVLGEDPVAKCMAMIRAEEVIEAVESYYHGGILTY